MDTGLKDKKAIVTGGASGLGHATSDTAPYFLDLDAPTLPAYEKTDDLGRTLWGIWSRHSRKWHSHGCGDGYRDAHCHNPASPYEATGYNLAYAGRWNERC